jgi:hypothetical protein
MGNRSVEKFAIANSTVEIPLDALWKKLDELHS